MNPYNVVRDFEQALCEYTGAKYAVTTNSCTMALLIALRHEWMERGEQTITIPKRTYCSVPMSVLHAGHQVEYDDNDWIGNYQLKPLRIWDSARYFTSGMFENGEVICCSFHWTKTLAIGQGGCILHDDDRADEVYRYLRFDGRSEGVPPNQDSFLLGYHAYMSPRDAAEGLSRLSVLPEHNDPLPNSDYPDLSLQECFK